MTAVQLVITDPENGRRGVRVPAGATLEVDPVDGDTRTQAERHADNALQAARLRRVEAELERALAHLDGIEAKGGVRLSTSGVRTVLQRALEAPIA